jgi:Tfp pilus assembly protein PilV
MWARARSQSGFTTIELLLAMMVLSVGVISLVGTLDVSRRATSYSEMKEAASHMAEQQMEELRALEYAEAALDGNIVPSSSADPGNPAHYLEGGGTMYRWDQKEDAPADHVAEPIVIDATNGKVESTAEAWSDGRVHGQIYRYVTCATPATGTADDCDSGPDTSAYKRVTVAVTVENAMGPTMPIMLSTLVSDPNLANGNANPETDPNTSCGPISAPIECTESTDGAVSTWYLYDTPATNSTRQEIAGSHATHATITGTPDLMGLQPSPSPTVTPPLYNYSNEITGGTTPGGAVVRRDTACTGGTPTTTDDTKGHFWVTPALTADMAVSDVALSIDTQTFNGATADVLLCVAVYDVPADIANLASTPPTLLVSKGLPQSGLTRWPTTAENESFVTELYEAGSATIAAGHRLGVRIWPSSSSEADIVVLYDHPAHISYLQVSG